MWYLPNTKKRGKLLNEELNKLENSVHFQIFASYFLYSIVDLKI